ncbi:MAG: hypothetical protein K2X32_15205, partial [Phycisphaerales bacterium]|nr:hypothetical protein [Phycisphaerales bacterium]
GRVEEYFGEPIQKLRKNIETSLGFQILIARTEIGGYCTHCQALRAREIEEAAKLGPRARVARAQ